MRWLAIVSALLISGCASAPMHSPQSTAVLIRPPPTIERPWLVPRPTDEITLFDTRTLQALRKLDEVEALNANGRVKRPGLWVGVGLGAATVGFLVADDVADDVAQELGTSIADTLFGCFFGALFGDDCDDD